MSKNNASAAGTDATILVERDGDSSRDILRGYAIAVDGHKAGSVRRKRSCTIPVRSGEHVVQLSIDWCKSPEVRVTVPAGGTVRLVCGPAAPAINLLRVAADMTVDRDSYIRLTVADAG